MAPTTKKQFDEYRVLSDGFVMTVGETRRGDLKVERFKQGDKVRPDPELVDIDRMVEMLALGDPDSDEPYPTTRQRIAAAASVGQEKVEAPADAGEVGQSEDGQPVNGLDDGGAGSSPTPGVV